MKFVSNFSKRFLYTLSLISGLLFLMVSWQAQAADLDEKTQQNLLRPRTIQLDKESFFTVTAPCNLSEDIKRTQSERSMVKDCLWFVHSRSISIVDIGAEQGKEVVFKLLLTKDGPKKKKEGSEKDGPKKGGARVRAALQAAVGAVVDAAGAAKKKLVKKTPLKAFFEGNQVHVCYENTIYMVNTGTRELTFKPTPKADSEVKAQGQGPSQKAVPTETVTVRDDLYTFKSTTDSTSVSIVDKDTKQTVYDPISLGLWRSSPKLVGRYIYMLTGANDAICMEMIDTRTGQKVGRKISIGKGTVLGDQVYMVNSGAASGKPSISVIHTAPLLTEQARIEADANSGILLGIVNSFLSGIIR